MHGTHVRAKIDAKFEQERNAAKKPASEIALAVKTKGSILLFWTAFSRAAAQRSRRRSPGMALPHYSSGSFPVCLRTRKRSTCPRSMAVPSCTVAGPAGHHQHPPWRMRRGCRSWWCCRGNFANWWAARPSLSIMTGCSWLWWFGVVWCGGVVRAWFLDRLHYCASCWAACGEVFERCLSYVGLRPREKGNWRCSTRKVPPAARHTSYFLK